MVFLERLPSKAMLAGSRGLIGYPRRDIFPGDLHRKPIPVADRSPRRDVSQNQRGLAASPLTSTYAAH